MPIFTKESTLELENLSIANEGDVHTYFWMLEQIFPSVRLIENHS